MGYTAGSFTAGQQPTTAQWNVLWANDASFNDGTGIANAVITANKLATGATPAYVATSEQSSSTSYADIPAGTVGPSVTVTIGANKLAIVILTATLNSDTANANCYMGFVVSGANTLAAQDKYALQTSTPSGGGLYSVSATFLLDNTILTAAGSTTFKAQYRVGSHTGTFATRHIAVVPL